MRSQWWRVVGAFVAVGALCGCEPSAGRFCREDSPQNCWDIDIPARKMTLVNLRGERMGNELKLQTAQAPADYWVPGLDSKILIKVIDRNTIGIRNSESDTPTFNRWIRKR